MTYVLCTRCNGTFQRESHETWKKLCVDCWRAAQSNVSKTHNYADIVRGLRKHIDVLIVRCAPLDDEETRASDDEAYEWLNSVADRFDSERGQ